ncbi:MAG: sensor histidine kinase [Gaiellales bacterium]
MLRSLRARLLLVGIVPVVVALAVTAVLTVRSLNHFAEEQRAAVRQQQVGELERIVTGLSRVYGRLVGPAVLGETNQRLRREDLEAAAGGKLFYVPLIDMKLFPISALGLAQMQVDGTLPDTVTKPIGKGQAIALPPELLPPSMRDDVVVARGMFATSSGNPGNGVPYGLLVLTRPVPDVPSPAGTLRRSLVPAFAIGLAVAVLLALVMSLRLVRPLRQLAAAARSFARGSEDVELDMTRGDEIGAVNHAFNDMMIRLADARDRERLFLMRVSHELRTPLTAIRSQVDALEDGIFEGEDEQRAAYAAITAESARLNRLIGDLLDLARLQAKRFGLESDEVDLNVLLEQVVSGQGSVAREHDLDLSLQAGDLPVIVGDGDRILQIVSNLVRNALRWTPDGGTVNVSALAEEGRVWITVDDSGPGIPPDKRADIFRAFYTEDGMGTGLGLAISRELALAMGGTVTVADSPLGGARFVIELPAVHAPSAATARV